MNEAEIIDMLSADDEMPRISAVIWGINRVVFDEISRKYCIAGGLYNF